MTLRDLACHTVKVSGFICGRENIHDEKESKKNLDAYSVNSSILLRQTERSIMEVSKETVMHTLHGMNLMICKLPRDSKFKW